MMELNIFGLGQKIRMTGMGINNIRRLAIYAGWLSLTSTFIFVQYDAGPGLRSE